MAGVTVSKEGKSTLEPDRKSDDEAEKGIRPDDVTIEFWRRRTIETAGP